MSDLLYSPLRFVPLFQKKVWGGSYLSRKLGKPAPFEEKIGESWELSGWGDLQTVVAEGPLAGLSLGELVFKYPEEILGSSEKTFFPLLVKFIDAAQNLSVQVHPSKEQAVKYGWGRSGKTEAWYVVDAIEGAQIVVGFSRDVDEKEVREAVMAGSLESLLDYVPVKTGDMLFIPAGTVHAILGGTVIYEIQEESNTTFRLYDWNRKTAEGNLRELHIDEAIKIIDFKAGTMYRPEPQIIRETNSYKHSVRCGSLNFLVEEFSFHQEGSVSLKPGQFSIVTVIGGAVVLSYSGGSMSLSAGMTVLVPASIQNMYVWGYSDSRVLKTSAP